MTVGAMKRITFMVVLSLASGTGESRAGHEPFAVTVEFHAPPTCPDEVEFKTTVSDRLGYDAFLANAPYHVLVDISLVGRTLEGRIEWRNAEGRWMGERRFPSRSPDCQELVRAMGFALALQIQFSAATGAPPGSDDTPVPAEPPTAPVSERSTSPAPPARPQESRAMTEEAALTEQPDSTRRHPGPTLGIGGGAHLGFGLTSDVVPFGRIFGNVAWPHLALELAGELGWPTITRREDGAGFSQQLLLASVAGCGILARGSVCLLVKFGQIFVSGKDIDEPAWARGPIFETGLRLGWTQPLGRHVFVSAHGVGLVNVTHWRVTLDRYQVWSSSRLAATVGLDIGVSWP